MRRMMYLAASLMAAAAVFAACNKETQEPVKPGPEPGANVIRVTIPDALTKVSLTDQAPSGNGMALAWQNGDAIRVIGETSELYTIADGFDAHNAEFTGNPVEGNTFTLLYPGSFETKEALGARSYANQTQNGNGNSDHLTYNALISGVDTYEEVAFTEEWAAAHGGDFLQNGVLKLVVSLPGEVSVVKEAALVASSAIFNVNNMGTVKTDRIAVALENVDVSASGQVLTAYMNISAIDVPLEAGQTLTVKVVDDDAKEYSKSFDVPQATALKGGKMNTIRLTSDGGVEVFSDYFITVSGAGNLSGEDWDDAMNAEGLRMLLGGASARADAFDGVTFHFATGTYYLAEGLDKVTIDFENASEPIGMTFLGGYPENLHGTAQTGRDAADNITAFSGGSETGIFEIGSQATLLFDGITFKDVSVDSENAGAMYVSAADGSAATVTVTDCCFTNNRNTNDHTGASIILGKNSSASIEDCYFTDNYARNAPALHINAGASAEIKNCKFENNSSYNTSGAAQNGGSTDVTFLNCIFKNNTAGSWGGGAFHTAGSAETSFVGCTFKDNIATRCGGAISLESATVTCTNCTFTGNRADQGDQALAGQGQGKTAVKDNVGGGAIILRKAADVLTLNNCTFEGNIAPNGNGGAIASQTTEATINVNEGTTFSGNTAFMHGASIFSMGVLNIKGTESKKVTFTGEKTLSTGSGVSNGGSVYITGSTTSSLVYAVFTNCEAGQEEGSTVNYSNGGAISMRDVTSFLMDQCEFSGNRGRNGGCINMELGSSSVCKITNCNFHDNICRSGANKDGTSGNFSGAAARLGGGTVEFEKCLFKNNVVNNASAVLHMNADNAIARFTDCVLSGNECRSNNVCIKMEKTGNRLYMNRCLFEGNHGNTRGMINPANNTLVYLNDVTFKDNYTTGGSGWGVNIHASAANICMNNVTSYNNYCSNASPGSCVSFNSDGGWLIVNSSILDKTPLALIRGKSRQITICNDILINNNTAGNVILLQTTGKLNDCGHNVVSGTAAPSSSDAWASTDLQGVAESDLGTLSYSSNWTTSPYYGVYTWSGSLTGFTAATQTDVENAMKAGYTETDSRVTLEFGGSDIGKDFYNWLNSIGALGKDARGETRGTPWWPGAYQN